MAGSGRWTAPKERLSAEDRRGVGVRVQKKAERTAYDQISWEGYCPVCGLKGEGGSIWAERSSNEGWLMATSGLVAIELPQWLR